MNGFLNKNLKSYAKNWLAPVKYAEIQSKNAVRNQYTNLYAYGANNPIHYTDPDGRKTISAQVQELIKKIGAGFNLYVPPKLIEDLEIKGWEYIGNDNNIVQELNEELKDFANNNDEMMVKIIQASKTITETQEVEKDPSELIQSAKEMYLSNALGAKPSQIAERNSGDKKIISKTKEYTLMVYTVSAYDPVTDRCDHVYKSFIDVNNDGNIDLFAWGLRGGFNDE